MGSISSEKLENEKIEFNLMKSLIKMKFDDIDFTRVESYFDAVDNIRLLNKLNSIKEVNTTQEITLKNFFKKGTNDKIINEIQASFSDCIGKKMAIVIHLLQNKLKLTEIISSSKTYSRKHFIYYLKNNYSFNKMSAINKYLNPYTDELNLSTNNESDLDYIQILSKLVEISKKEVV